MLPLVIGILVALFACRLNEWLPQYMTQQEEELVAQIIETHAISSGEYGPQPLLAKALNFWQWPACTIVNLCCAVWVLLLVQVGFSTYTAILQALLWSFWGAGLIVLAIVDARTKLLPDALTLPLLWLGILIQLFPETRTVGLEMSVIGAVAGYLPLWLLAQAYRLIRGRDGLGMGDLKLLAAMGAWSGPFLLPQVLLLAALLAIAVYVIERVLRRSADGFHDERPFGPSIVAAYFIVLLFTHSLGTI